MGEQLLHGRCCSFNLSRTLGYFSIQEGRAIMPTSFDRGDHLFMSHQITAQMVRKFLNPQVVILNPEYPFILPLTANSSLAKFMSLPPLFYTISIHIQTFKKRFLCDYVRKIPCGACWD